MQKVQKLSFGKQCFMHLDMEPRINFFGHVMYTHIFMVILYAGML